MCGSPLELLDFYALNDKVNTRFTPNPKALYTDAFLRLLLDVENDAVSSLAAVVNHSFTR